jgi:hypothetical protein
VKKVLLPKHPRSSRLPKPSQLLVRNHDVRHQSCMLCVAPPLSHFALGSVQSAPNASVRTWSVAVCHGDGDSDFTSPGSLPEKPGCVRELKATHLRDESKRLSLSLAKMFIGNG